jgi:hypothetical protein
MDPTAQNSSEPKKTKEQNTAQTADQIATVENQLDSIKQQSEQHTQQPAESPPEPPQEQTPEQPAPAEQEEQPISPSEQQQPNTDTDQAAMPATKSADQPPNPPGNVITDHKLFLPFILIVIVILCVAIFALLMGTGKSGKNENTAPTPTPQSVKKAVQPTPVATKTQTFVYGTWTSQSSVVRAVDLGNDTIKTLATLPLSIKKISVLSPTTLLYIDQTDTNDHGARISVYNTQQKQITTNIPADQGYGIDDYVLSPDKRYIAIWEVKFSPDTQTLQGGQSRVYAVDLTQPTVTNLLYDEDTTTTVGTRLQTVPIHYPVAILSDGKVFTDQFLANDPNGGTGWAYGMSIVDFDGTNKQDITSMPNGTYGSKPTLSPDGKFLLFAGYDGSNGDGTKIINGYRQALLTPDTVELLDTNSFSRYKLPNLPPSNTYSDVQWDRQTANVIISILSQDTKQMGVYVYDLGKLSSTQISLPLANGTQYGYISQLTNTNTLIGIQSTDPSNLGNLGETYAFAYTQLATVDSSGQLSYISVEDPFIQYITLLPGNYFANVLGTQTSKQTAPQPDVTYEVLQGTQNNPQNSNFFLKTTLASLRIQGKSSALGLTTDSAGFTICQNVEKANNKTANACY